MKLIERLALNGKEQVRLCTLIRFHSDKQWGDWRTPEEWMPLVFAIGKRRGEWQSQVIDGGSKLVGSLASAKKASCDQIPGENASQEEEAARLELMRRAQS